MIGFTLPEIRRLLVNLILRHTHPATHVWSWSDWRRRRQHQPASATTADAATHSNKCRCSTRESTLQRLGRTALPATELLTLLTRRDEHGEPDGDQPDVLVILDCCFSGAGGVDVLNDSLRGIGNPRTWIMASAGPMEWARDGRFAAALADELREPTTGSSQQYLSLETLVQQVNNACGGEQVVHCFYPSTGLTGSTKFFPNPAYWPNLAGLTVDDQHWRSRLQAGETDTSGFYFTGRTGRVRAIEDLAAWLTPEEHGGELAVLTGSPGSGKSALLALLVFLADAALREDLLCGAEPDSPAAARRRPAAS